MCCINGNRKKHYNRYIMFKRRVLHREGEILGQRKVFFWWVTVRHFTFMSDALKWLGYDDY